MSMYPRALATGVSIAVLSMSLVGGSSPVAASPSTSHSTAPPLLIHPGYLTIGTDATYPPMESQDPQTHQFIGADIDLGRALAKAMGLKGAQFVNNSFDTIIPALFRGNFDVVMSSMNDTPKRRRQIAFVDYMRASQAIVVKKDSSIHADSYAQMCGHSVAVETGTTELDGLRAADKKCTNKIDIKAFTADTAAFQAFTSGHTDAYTGDLPVAALYVKQHSAALRLAGKPFGAGENYGIGLLYKDKALRANLKKALAKIRKSGQYRHILDKWGVGGASF